MAEAKKDTIYIDVDDEITSLVEKVQKSKSKIVALVLPKRAVVLQSIVNMKLLKRSADDADKRVVLITSETGLLPLAGAVGVYTAKNLQTKPEIPAAPESDNPEDELLESDEPENEEPDLDKAAAVGALAGGTAAAAAAKGDDDDVFEDTKSTQSKPKKEKTKSKSKDKKSKKNKVPNFEKFRLKVIIGVAGVIAILALSYWAFFAAPRATVAITTETSDVNATIDFTASETITEANIDESIIPATRASEADEDAQTAPATGKKDLGTKATGSVRLAIACADVSGSPPTVPAGTGVSTGGLTFITDSSTSLTTPSFGGGCQFIGNAAVTAQENGDQYNIGSGKTFTVAGFGNISGSNANAFSGGTSKIATVVSQQDIDSATEKLEDNEEAIKTELTSRLESEGLFALTGTFSSSDSSTTASPKLDQEGSEVTVTRKQTYSMLGVSQDDLKALIESSVQSQADEQSLQVQDDGLGGAVFRLGSDGSDTEQPVSMQVQVALGPKIDEEQLKGQIAGKKKGDVQNIVDGIQGVQQAEVTFSPFWVSSAPKNTSKITIEYKEATQE